MFWFPQVLDGSSAGFAPQIAQYTHRRRKYRRGGPFFHGEGTPQSLHPKCEHDVPFQVGETRRVPAHRPVEFWAGKSSFDLREGLAHKAEQFVPDSAQTQDERPGISDCLACSALSRRARCSCPSAEAIPSGKDRAGEASPDYDRSAAGHSGLVYLRALCRTGVYRHDRMARVASDDCQRRRHRCGRQCNLDLLPGTAGSNGIMLQA